MAKKAHTISPKLETELAINNIVPLHYDNYASVLHCVNPGDLMGAMGAIKKYHDVTKRKMKVYQSLTQPGAYYGGAVHPTVNERGEMVCCNKPMFDMLKPLVESQPYIHSMEVYEGQKIDFDFNTIRGKTFVNLPNGALQNWVPLCFHDLEFDLSKKWIELDGKCPTHIKNQVSKKVILNFTERYRNQTTDYFFLKNYAPDLIFAGTEREHFLFCSRWNLTIPRLEVKNFLELAYAIRECRFMLCNQSMCYNIASAMLTPRILEICSYAQNCIHGIGEHSYGFLLQLGAEYYFRKLYNITA